MRGGRSIRHVAAGDEKKIGESCNTVRRWSTSGGERTSIMSKRAAKKDKARAAQRRAQRRAAKTRAKRKDAKERAPVGPRTHAIMGWGAPAADGLYDDCPICRAMRAAGVPSGHDGVVTMTPEMQTRYQTALDEIIAKEGWPEDAVIGTGEELTNWYDAINEDLEANGHPTDLEAMTDAELDAHWDRVEETSMRLFGRRGAARKPALAS